MSNSTPANMINQKTDLKTTHHVTTFERPLDRKVLGQLSPNRQINTTASSGAKAAIPDNQLKRSYIGSLHNDQGLKYLKRRRMSPLSTESSTEIVSSYSNTLARLQSEADMISSIEANDDAHSHESSQHQSDRESSSERHSFSSLINYDPSSQPKPTIYDETLHPRTEPGRPTETAAMRNVSATTTETLRLRLQIAMYKVRTKQIDVPFAYLREDTSTGSRESDKAVAEAVEQLRREAQDRLKRQGEQQGVGVQHTDGFESMHHQQPLLKASTTATISSSGETYEEPSPKKKEIAVGLLGLKNSI